MALPPGAAFDCQLQSDRCLTGIRSWQGGDAGEHHQRGTHLLLFTLSLLLLFLLLLLLLLILLPLLQVCSCCGVYLLAGPARLSVLYWLIKREGGERVGYGLIVWSQLAYTKAA